MGIPDHLNCLLRNLYTGQEATVRTRNGTIDRFQIGKAVRQGCILSPCLFNLYAEYIMRNAGLGEAQAQAQAESEQAPGVGDGQGGLACCNPWGRREADMTERLS